MYKVCKVPQEYKVHKALPVQGATRAPKVGKVSLATKEQREMHPMYWVPRVQPVQRVPRVAKGMGVPRVSPAK